MDAQLKNDQDKPIEIHVSEEVPIDEAM